MTLRLAHDWLDVDLPANVTIGEGSWLYSAYAFRHYRSRRPCGVRIGRDSGVYNNSYFDLGADGEVEIGDFCTIVGAIMCSNQRIEVHDYAFVAHEVVIADHPCSRPFDEDTNDCGTSKPRVGIVLGENCWIGARAILLTGARIGRDAIVGAGAVVDFAVPDGATAAGNPARIVAKRGHA